MWYILNKTYDTVGVLDNKIPNGIPILRDSWKGQLEDGYTTLEFDVFASHPKASLLTRGSFIIYTDNPDGYELFRITKPTESHGLDEVKTIYCETAATQDLIGQIIEPKSFVGASLSDIVRFLLSNTGWELGVCYYDEIISIDFDDYPTALEAIRNTIKQFGAEIEFKVEFDGQEVVRRIVNLYEKRGTKTGVSFEYSRNLEGLRKIEDGNKVVTAMIGIASNEDANGNPILLMNAQKKPPEGFEVIGNMIVDVNALQEYGNNGVNVVDKFIDQTAMNPVELFDNTLEALKKVNHPIVSYEADVLMMEQLEGYEHTKVSIGDTIFVKDVTSQPPTYLEARILNKELSTVQKDKGSIVLGEYVPLTIQPIQAVEKAQRTLQLKEKLWNATIDRSKEAQEGVEEVKKQVPYKVDFESSNGTVFKNGVIDTQITAIVYKGKENITDTLPKTAFIWTKTDKDGFFDVAWNYDHVGVGKTISVSSYDLFEKANFKCEIDLPDE
ncbi:phage tail spike protein [Priestia aryabhattai]